MKVPPEQEGIRARCFHPSGMFVEFPREDVETSIPERFEKIVRAYPDRLAVKMGNRSLTYNELNRAANRIARAILAKRGDGSEPIALLFEHGPDAIAAIFGVLKTGKLYVPLDPKFPLDRLRYILEDSKATLLVTNNQQWAGAQTLKNDTFGLLNLDEINEAVPSHDLLLTISPDDLADVLYTSGSQGLPKGVKVTHRTSMFDCWAVEQRSPCALDDRLSLIHSLSFGSAQPHLHQALLTGAALFPFDVKSMGVVQMATWLEEERITILHTPPALFRQLAECLPDQERLTSFRLVYLSGAPLTKLDFALYKKHLPKHTLLGLHMGSTEARVTCLAIINRNFRFPERGTPAGYPVPGKKVLLLDANGHEVGPGQVGEIAVKSRYLNLGYLNRPELTKSKFLTVPDGDERIYLTGDLGRMLPDGFLIHLGRKDLMVKIRGYRVELEEVEWRLNEHPEVKDVGVTAWERDDGEKYLVAYVVPRHASKPTVDQLQNFLRETLPDYMIPSAFTFLDSLPLTNGKLDRRVLPKPDDKRPELSTPYTLPRNEIEKSLVQIWEEVLDVRPIGIHDKFFDLGGHSLSATRVVSRVIEQFEVEIPLQSLFESPTIADMAALITEHREKTLDENKLATILDELELLSDEESQRRASERRREDS